MQRWATPSRLLRYGVALGLTALALLLWLFLAQPILRPPFALFLVAVAISAWYGGTGPGLLAAVLSILASDYFYLSPIYSLKLSNTEDAAPLAAFSLVVLVISSLSGRLRDANLRAESALAKAEAAEQRSAFLAEASSILAGSLDYETTLQSLARLAVTHLADRCVIHLLDEQGTVRRLVTEHVDPAKKPLVRELEQYPPISHSPHSRVAEALRTGRPQLMTEVPDSYLEAVARDARHLQLLRETGFRSSLAVPLVARGRALGALLLVSGRVGRYGPDDLALAEELAHRAAMAIDNARLYADARSAEARYRSLFEGAADAILVTDARGRYLAANGALTELLGYSHDELQQLPDVGRSIVAAGESWVRRQFTRLTREGRWFGEIELKRKDGTIVPVEARVQAVELPTGTVYLGSWRDISERRKLARMQQEFLSMAAHELRNPLAALSGYAQILQRRGSYDERAVSGITSQAARLQRLIGDLLDVSRLDSGRLELRRTRADLAELARLSAEQVQASSPAHAVRVEAPPRPIEGWWDPDRISQVFDNLLSNAVKYTRDGEIVVRVEDLGQEARVEIRDHGPGIPPEALPRLFERFYRVGSPGTSGVEGLGLGLYVTRSLVEAHGGRVQVHSVPGEGTTFSFTLPCGQIPAERAQSAGLLRT